MNEAPLFSVIILLYNNEEYIRCAIDSVLAQTYPAVEVIIADDHSRQVDLPGIREYLNAHKRDNILRTLVYQNPENLGTVQNINCALGRAEGQYIKLLAADDALYDETVLARSQRALDASESGIIASRVMKCRPDMTPIAPFRDELVRSLPRMSAGEVWRQLCVHNDLAATGIFFARRFFDRFGFFDQRYRLLEDWPTWLRITREGARIGYGDFFSTRYRSDAGSATGVNQAYLADRQKAFQQEVRPYRKELGGARYLRAWMNLKLRNCVLVRRLYGRIFRR